MPPSSPPSGPTPPGPVGEFPSPLGPSPPPPPSGLSPRRRGTRRAHPARRADHGSIPAQAGEPTRTPRASSTPWVYPRAGGGTTGTSISGGCGSGLSPRRRGNLREAMSIIRCIGSIPAQAGEPHVGKHSVRSRQVYPRAGGGTACRETLSALSTGLSPRRRGNPTAGRRTAVGSGSIPAQAGEPTYRKCSRGTSWVYPRAGGGTYHFIAYPIAGPGLSPRRRGNPILAFQFEGQVGSIPAQAGEPDSGLPVRGAGWVYPRAGGGTVLPQPLRIRERGLSPRRRGNRGKDRRGRQWHRSIPAQAGEPVSESRCSRPGRVYPRAGGGTEIAGERVSENPGLSPRRRGNHVHDVGRVEPFGSIPAQAGEPSGRSTLRSSPRVYPRAGGGTASRGAHHEPVRVYPRAGGGTQSGAAGGACVQGLSPRRRGNLLRAGRLVVGDGSIPALAGNRGRGVREVDGVGSIPAQAGEPATTATSGRRPWVYPRAGGGTSGASGFHSSESGLSPRRRGNPGQALPGAARRGSIPAQAGEPGTSPSGSSAPRVYPRAGGGTSTCLVARLTFRGLSPRRRGNPDPGALENPAHWSIPAQAGEPSSPSSAVELSGVYPRAGGGTSRVESAEHPVGGLSPRRRGNRSLSFWSASNSRSIPAQAGEPGQSPQRDVGSGVYPRAGGGTGFVLRWLEISAGLSPRRRGNRRPRVHRNRRCGSIPAQAGEPEHARRVHLKRRVYPRAGGGTCGLRRKTLE